MPLSAEGKTKPFRADARALSVLIASERGSSFLFEHDLFAKPGIQPRLRGAMLLLIML
jgi:hypothetical protein